MTMLLAGVSQPAVSPFRPSQLKATRQITAAALQVDVTRQQQLIVQAKRHAKQLAFIGFTDNVRQVGCKYLKTFCSDSALRYEYCTAPRKLKGVAAQQAQKVLKHNLERNL